MIGSRADVADALRVLARSARALATGAPTEQTYAELLEAAARGTGAEVAVLWVPAAEGTLQARAVWAASAGVAAELEGLRVEPPDGPAALVRRRLGRTTETFAVPFAAADGDGQLALARQSGAFEHEDGRVATIAAELA
ncbi:MAG: hypothetical protein HOQ03_11430, partial [Thermoleophilia bacterium]|nr:hypothetical protein [Thermoleophilia bacterium]